MYKKEQTNNWSSINCCYWDIKYNLIIYVAKYSVAKLKSNINQNKKLVWN